MNRHILYAILTARGQRCSVPVSPAAARVGLPSSLVPQPAHGTAHEQQEVDTPLGGPSKSHQVPMHRHEIGPGSFTQTRIPEPSPGHRASHSVRSPSLMSGSQKPTTRLVPEGSFPVRPWVCLSLPCLPPLPCLPCLPSFPPRTASGVVRRVSSPPATGTVARKRTRVRRVLAAESERASRSKRSESISSPPQATHSNAVAAGCRSGGRHHQLFGCGFCRHTVAQTGAQSDEIPTETGKHEHSDGITMSRERTMHGRWLWMLSAGEEDDGEREREAGTPPSARKVCQVCQLRRLAS